MPLNVTVPINPGSGSISNAALTLTAGGTKHVYPLSAGPGGYSGTIDCVRTGRSEEHTSELQSPCNLVCRLLLEKKKIINDDYYQAHRAFRIDETGSSIQCEPDHATLARLRSELTAVSDRSRVMLCRLHLCIRRL